jgi:phosphate:Na+ symporter
MVVGENIGTTATAILAGIVANRSARRTALAHLLFNLFGLIWVLPLIGLVSGQIELLTSAMNIDAANQIPIGISIFHTSFNLLNAVLLTILFVPFKKLCLAILPNGNGINEVFSLKYIDNSILSTSELSILQVRKEIAYMGKQVTSHFNMVPELLLEKKEHKFAKKFKQIQKGEELIDELEIQIAGYITKISEAELSSQGKQRVEAMLKIIDYLETIADYSYQMSLTIVKKREANAWFTQELRNNLSREFNLIEKSLKLMVKNLENDYMKVDLQEARQIEDEINKLRSELKQAYLNEINREKLPYKTGVYYNDLLGLSEKIGNYAFMVNQTVCITEQKQHSKTNQKTQRK